MWLVAAELQNSLIIPRYPIRQCCITITELRKRLIKPGKYNIYNTKKHNLMFDVISGFNLSTLQHIPV